MNNNVKKVVFYSTRYIHPYFSDEEHLKQCNCLIEYFSGLKKSEEEVDDFSQWLSDLAFLYEYRQKVMGIKVTALNELLSDLYSEKKGEIQKMRNERLADILTERENENSYWITADNEFNALNDSPIVFEPKHYEEHQDWVLTGTTTHLNRTGEFLEGNKDARLKHRLGIYHKEGTDEDKEYAVAAIWPWAGDKEFGHDQNWMAAILKTVCELYPHNEEIVLVIHDGDLERYAKRDKIVYAQKELSEKYDELQRQLTVNPIVSFVVFQHTNDSVLSPLKVDNNGKKKSPKQIWEDINKYIVLNETFRDKDKENVIANKHGEVLAKLESYESK